jgi:ABC-type sugar transport system ATPase subunit
VTAIRLVDVTKVYEGSDATSVSGVTESIEEGEFFVLLGPSGCGKTTLLKLLAGLEEPTSGEIYIGDELVNWVEPGDRNVAMVFQNYALYPNMSVRDNVRFPLRMRGVRGERAERLVQESLGFLELGRLADRKIGQLSGGERQRVALARAIVREPSVTLMDEPLSNLDAQLRHQTRAELVRLHRAVPGTVVYVTHDQIEAMTMAERIGIMHQGRLVQVGAPEEIYRHPATLFVGQFLGSPPMNAVKVSAVRDAGEVRLRGGGVDRAVPDPLREAVSQLPAEEELVLGIRPEDLKLATGEGDGAWVVDLVEYVGTEYVVSLRAPEPADTVLRARVPRDAAPRVGQGVGIEIPDSSVYVFDAGGRNLALAGQGSAGRAALAGGG